MFKVEEGLGWGSADPHFGPSLQNLESMQNGSLYKAKLKFKVLLGGVGRPLYCGSTTCPSPPINTTAL